MLDLAEWLVMFLVSGGLGLHLARLLPRRFAWRELLAPTFGIAVLAVIVPLAYRLGLTMRVLLIASTVIALPLIAVHLRAHPIARSRRNAQFAAALLVTSMVILAPRWTGGDQFCVFRANHWDSFSYVEAAITFGEKPYSTIDRAREPQQLRNPTFFLAQIQLPNRPSAHELYALFSRIAPDEAYRQYYTYLAFFMVQMVLVGLFVIRNALPRAPAWSWFAIAVAFPLGFWGQYVLDLDAWSQVASAPLLLALFGLALHIGNDWIVRDAARLASGIAVASAGAIYLYPEGLAIYGVALLPVTIGLAIAGMRRAREWTIRRLLPFTGFLGVTVAALSPDLVRLLVGQLGRSNAPSNNWWIFFQRFFLGRDNVWGAGFDRAIDFTSSLLGLYFVTPADDGVLGQRIALLIIIGGLMISLALMVRAHEPERASVIAWIAASLLMLMPALFLVHKESYWAGGKVVSYAAPIFVPLLCLPLARRSRWRWFAVVYVAVQIASGIVRISAVTWDGHTGYAAPYPIVADLKHGRGWELRGLERYLDASSRVTVHASDPWSQSALIAFLSARRIPYVLQLPVTLTPGGPPLGQMPMPWTPQIELTYRGDVVQLDYLDHSRPSVSVPTRD